MKTVKISDPEQIEKYYNEAKCIFSKDKKKAIALINQLPLDYFEGFMAFTDAIEKKEDLIHNRIIIIKIIEIEMAYPSQETGDLG